MAATRTAPGVDQYVQKLEKTIQNDQEVRSIVVEGGSFSRDLVCLNMYFLATSS